MRLPNAILQWPRLYRGQITWKIKLKRHSLQSGRCASTKGSFLTSCYFNCSSVGFFWCFLVFFLAHLSSAQDELLWSLFVRRPSVRASVRQHFQTTSPLKPLSQFCSNFIWSLLRVGERKIAKMVAVRWPRWPPRPYVVKTFKNLLLQNRECLGSEPLQESSGTGGLPKLLKELSYIDVWPFYGKVKFASLCICMGKTFKNLLL